MTQVTELQDNGEPITIILPPKLIADIDEARGPLSRSTFFRRLIKRNDIPVCDKLIQVELPDDGKWLKDFMKKWVNSQDEVQAWKWHMLETPTDILDAIEASHVIEGKRVVFLDKADIKWLKQEIEVDMEGIEENEKEYDLSNHKKYMSLLSKAKKSMLISSHR